MELAFLDMTLQLLMKSPDCTCIYPICLHIIHEVFMRSTVGFLAEILTHCVHSVSSTYRISKSMYYAVPPRFHMTKFQFKLEKAKEIIDQFTYLVYQERTGSLCPRLCHPQCQLRSFAVSTFLESRWLPETRGFLPTVTGTSRKCVSASLTGS